MSMLFGRKTAGTKLGTINYARGLVISLYLVSWIFSFAATMLVQTNNFNFISCSISVFLCISLYALSKIIIYLFLMEKVYVVTAVGSTRRDFKLYKLNLVLMLPYFGILALMFQFRVAGIASNGYCYIGLLKPAALPLIFYDIFLSCWLTALFIRPLMSSTSRLQGPSKGRLRDVARRTLLGCIIALILSSANVFTLVYFDGHERGLICLASCTADVTLNAITIHWVTSRGGGRLSGTERRERRGGGGGGGGVGVVAVGGGGHVMSGQYGMSTFEKQVAPAESHLSITVESYVEEYHQLHYGNSSTPQSHYGYSN
ncbi:hypothetical protein BGW38_008171 [Lunasporangiospora selenospora]|uniref:Transmembrane protein n=1 Tax=Lunasporangiospora selenospora TaxID=979761 RepID=A0A9P6K9P3_9FUNG|nr:hypothetical protein BGW38_008171 [Lunasporangiospora selenospora]